MDIGRDRDGDRDRDRARDGGMDRDRYRDRDRDEDRDRELRPFSRCFDLLYSQGHGTFLLVQLFFLVQGLGFRV